MIRPQYHFRQVDGHTHIWEVRKLAARIADHPIINVALTDIREIHEPYWFHDQAPTCARIIAHAQQCADADLDYPIILCNAGRIMDGMHRVMKAYGLGHSHIKARQFNMPLAPDYIDIPAENLPY